ncbi:hypothetical protein BU15DRAFT_86088 [Melanogaster broomeanus]|nr:hypothetical protein BU15DRAFT_86088 [Melanogaster broomeanus]
MQEADEQGRRVYHIIKDLLTMESDTCRICSAPGEPGQPLFYPCKCSGTIRYIHQDCLTTWLSHSKKKTCDVCKHPYSFTKVYATDMPPTLPPLLLMRRLAQQAFFAFLFGLRAVMIATVWLAVLPWITIWTWRVYFTMGESTAWWISGRERPADSRSIGIVETLTATNETVSLWRNAAILQRFTSRPFWQTLSADIFAGQIIASLIVLIFVAVFLLREWISQNARPGMFEVDDLAVIHPQDLPAPNPAPINQPVQELNGRLVAPPRLQPLNREIEEGRQPRLLRPRRVIPQRPHLEPLPRHVEDIEQIQRREDPIPRIPLVETPPPLLPLPPKDEILPAGSKGKAKEEDEGDVEMTFSDVRRRIRRRLDHDEQVPSRSPTPGPAEPSSSSGTMHIEMGSTFRRPPMSTSTVNTEGDSSPNKLQPVSPSGPLASPSLATYVAPEELEAGSSSAPTGYFDGKKRARDSAEDEFQHYFHDPEPARLDDNDNDDKGHGEAPREDRNLDGVGRPREAPAEDGDDDEEEGEEEWDRDFWDADADREEDEDEGDDGMDFDNLNIPNRPGPQPPQAQIQAAVEQLNEGVDDLEAGVEDDMEGALEAIGLRGPIFGVVQNAVLMIFVLDTAIGFAVWLPFTLGKTAALLSLDPPRALYILHLPIRAMRLVTDPVVDFSTLVLGRFVLPFFYRVFGLFAMNILGIVLFLARTLAGPSASTRLQDIAAVGGAYIHYLYLAAEYLTKSELFDVAMRWMQSSPQESSPSLPQRINDFFDSDSAIARLLEPCFAYLGREVKLFADHFHNSWIRLALGHGTAERAFAVCLGYGVVSILMAVYLNVFTVGNARTAGRAIRTAVRQQLLVAKVAMFIIIELVIFPLGCGIMLDGCTIWVFPEASLESRLVFFTHAPLTAMFYHWVAGTMFMYQFAILLAGCRNIMRSGAMWFIKDPQDQNFHPIRDILDRPTFTQFRKLLISAFMYATVVACGVGSLAVLLFIGNKSIFPIRWKTRDPLSDVPIDLLFLQVVLPYTMRYLKPRKVVYRVATRVWKFLSAKLRLTSYMFGNRPLKEEYTKHYKTWDAFFRRSSKGVEAVTSTRTGTFRRVPATDNIALPRDMRATAEVTENGTPVNDAAKELIASQNAEAVKAKRDVSHDYIVVYFPPHFRIRIIAFVAAVWMIMAVVAAVSIAVPVQLGRRFFTLFTSSQVHDGYSFLAGFYLMWACYLVVKVAEEMDKRRQRGAGDGPRAQFAVFFAKRSLLWLSKITYLALFLGVIIPLLLGLVADLYIVMPVRLTLNPTLVPSIRLVDMWSLGLVYCKVAIRLRRRIQLPARLARALQMLLNNGWTNPDPRRVTKELILPLMAGLLGMLLVPAGTVYVLREFFEIPLSRKFLLMHAYPGIFAVVGLSRVFVSSVSMLRTWSQSIRDNEFLVEMRLQNHEPEKLENTRAEPPTAVKAPHRGDSAAHRLTNLDP